MKKIKLIQRLLGEFNAEMIHQNLLMTSTLVFNVAVSILYIAVKHKYTLSIIIAGAVAAIQIIPFAFTAYISVKQKHNRKTILLNLIILFYLFTEILFNYILNIPFREILWLHIIYIILFYIAEYSMIVILWKLNRKKGILALMSFICLKMCLIYLYS